MVSSIGGISNFSSGTNVYQKFKNKYAACPADYGYGPYIQPIAQPVVPIPPQPPRPQKLSFFQRILKNMYI